MIPGWILLLVSVGYVGLLFAVAWSHRAQADHHGGVSDRGADLLPAVQGTHALRQSRLETASAQSPVVVSADPKTCSFQFNPVGTSKFTTSCDIAKSALARAGIPYSNVEAPAGTVASVRVGSVVVAAHEGTSADAAAEGARFGSELKTALTAAGYPEKADPARINEPMLLLLLTILVIYVTMVYGPIEARLVELFPTRIRYASMSLP